MDPSSPLPEGFSELDVFALGSCLLVEGLLGFLMNAVTVIAFLKIRALRTPSNFLVFSLALADMGISTNAIVAAFSSFLRYWPYGSEGCQTHGFHGFLTALSSIHFIAAIAWDRYHQYSTRTKLQWSSAITIATFIWVFTAFWAAMPLIGWGEYDYEPLRTCCTLDLSKGDRFMKLFSANLTGLANHMTGLFMSYTVMWHLLDPFYICAQYQRDKYNNMTSCISLRNYVTYLIPMAICNMGIQVLIVFFSYQSIDKKFKKMGQQRFNCSTPLKTLLFCWSPYGILAFYAAMENVNVLSPKLRMIAPIIAKTSPTFNVFVYTLGNENYRRGIWQLLTGEKTESPALTETKFK